MALAATTGLIWGAVADDNQSTKLVVYRSAGQPVANGDQAGSLKLRLLTTTGIGSDDYPG